ncbi:hypothetical protein J5N97_017237 [Dioscorea zingiberensis]|uniref:RING-CH-type domain-containing protein n=1 Tax=Dioscorea zingiberensis TaxID=325984 RepID=A0A9D5HGE0_9LILI|nr:hypothetical protein J5N97_017237 [Dioscorea zingiberensis]
MGDHLVVHVDQLVTPQGIDPEQGNEGLGSSRKAIGNVGSAAPPSSQMGSTSDKAVEEKIVIDDGDEEEPLIQTVECRICQEEDDIKNLETPCACSGSLKYAHRVCVQRWCTEKGDITCEICHESYKPGYTAPPRPQPDEATIDINGGWTITGMLLQMLSSAAFCRSAVLILMALLLLRHALSITNGDEDDDASTYFSLFLLRAAGFLLPCYIMAWAISILQQRRQRQEAATMAAREVAYILQSGQGRGLQFTIAPESPSTPQQEPNQQ